MVARARGEPLVVEVHRVHRRHARHGVQDELSPRAWNKEQLLGGQGHYVGHLQVKSRTHIPKGLDA
jgi:hypothetical protein